MLQQIFDFFLSLFMHPSVWGITLAIVFGIIWLISYWPPILRKPWLWAIFVAGVFLTPIAFAFIQYPIQIKLQQSWGPETTSRWLLLIGIPVILTRVLVQEGAKLVPATIYWCRKGRKIDPKLGLIIGAVSGAGFGIFEAQWILNATYAYYGWNWDLVQTNGFLALIPFTERFFYIAFHAGSCALAGYGLAKGWGWQFYLLASLLHFILGYTPLLIQSIFTSSGSRELATITETFISVWAILITGATLWLRWRKLPEKNV